MTQWHHKSKRKISGGIRTTVRRSDKKLAWKGNEPINTTLTVGKETEEKVVVAKAMGGNIKQKAAKVHTAHISDGKKVIKAKILNVVENKANKLFTRRNIITKGALIKVQVENSEKLAQVTSRPGQAGTVSAVFVPEKKAA